LLTTYKNLVNEETLQLAVKNNFSRFCKTYEKFACVQKETALILGKENLYGIGIDLGCGTGFLTESIKRNYNKILGVDISKEMIAYYNEKGFTGVNADIENLPFKDNTFDFAVSNFSLHWTDLNKSFKEVYRVLKKDAVFLFSIPVEGSLKELHEKLYKTFDFPNKEIVLEILKKHNFKIKEYKLEKFNLHFKNGKQVIEYFKYTGTAFNKKAQNLADKIRTYKQTINLGEIKTSFCILFIKAQK
jgi:malonyl-CoA O-methyltransferase